MKKTKLISLAAIAFLLIGSFVMFTACPTTSSNGGGGDKYTVTFDGNGNTGGTVPAKLTQSEAGAAVTIPGAGNLVKTGNAFSGWNTQADGKGTAVPAGSYTPTADITLYAQWSPIADDEYVITFVVDPDEAGYFTPATGVGTLESFTAKINTDVTFKLAWDTTYNLISVKAGDADVPVTAGVYSYTQSTTDAVTITATGEIKPVETYDVNINYNGFGGTDQKVNVSTLNKPTEPTNPLESYVYRYGWFDDPTAGNEITFPYTVTEDMTIYARVAFINRADYDVLPNTMQWQTSDYYSLMINYEQNKAQATDGSLMLLFIDPRQVSSGTLFTINPFAGSPKVAMPFSDLTPLPTGITTAASMVSPDVIGTLGAKGSSNDSKTENTPTPNPNRNLITTDNLTHLMVLDLTHQKDWAGWSGFGNGLSVGHEISAITIVCAETWIPKAGTVTNAVLTVTFDGNGNTSGTVPAAITQSTGDAAVTIPGT
ncbi:MAG: InlB B-repeat-containing protein, partial [Treponema sp.]|nr:InlB B-repeat-containing protein [Treponema sp.]